MKEETKMNYINGDVIAAMMTCLHFFFKLVSLSFFKMGQISPMYFQNWTS